MYVIYNLISLKGIPTLVKGSGNKLLRANLSKKRKNLNNPVSFYQFRYPQKKNRIGRRTYHAFVF